jgi:hypothetical protein
MTQSTPPAAAPIVSPLERKLRYQNRLRSGANWFYWIAALSVINSVLMLTEASISFIFGLTATQIIDALAVFLAEDMQLEAVNTLRIVGWVLNLLIVGVYALFGVFANRRKKWAFIAGMALYILDALAALFIWGQPDLLSFAFHLIVIWGLIGGLRAAGKLDQIDAALRQAGLLPADPPPSAIQPM